MEFPRRPTTPHDTSRQGLLPQTPIGVDIANTGRSEFLTELFQDCLAQTSNTLGCNRELLKKILTSVTGLSIGISFFNSAAAFAGSNTALGYVYGSSEVLVSAAQSAWLLDEVLKYVQTNGRSKNRSLKIALLAFSIALCTALPATITSIKFNPSAPYLAGTTFLGDIISSSFTFYKFFMPLFSRGVSEKFIRIEALRLCLLERLDQGARSIINTTTEDPKTFTELGLQTLLPRTFDWRGLINTLVVKGAPQRRSSALTQCLQHDRQPASLLLNTVALAYPLCLVPAMFNIVSSETESQTGSEAAGIGLATLAAIPIYSLVFVILRKLFSNIIDQSSDFLEGRSLQGYSRKKHPKFFYPTFLLSAMVAAFSFGTIATIVDMGISDDSLKAVMIPFAITLTVLLRMFVFGDYVNKVGLAVYAAKEPVDSVEGLLLTTSSLQGKIAMLSPEDFLRMIQLLQLGPALANEKDTPLRCAHDKITDYLTMPLFSGLMGDDRRVASPTVNL